MNRKELVGVLAQTKEALSSQDIIPIYSHFAFDGDSVVAYDDMVAISFPVDFDIECCLPGVPLYRFLSSLKCKEVSVNLSDDTVTVKGGSSKVTFTHLPLSDFTFKIPNIDRKKSCTIDIDEDFLKGLELCNTSVSNDPTYLYTTGVTLCEDKQDGLLLFSTDLRTLSRYNLRATASKALKGYSVFPSKFCRIVAALNKVDNLSPLHLFIEEDYALAVIIDEEKDEDIMVFTKLIDPADTPDFIGAFKERTYVEEGELSEVPKTFLHLLERADVVFGSGVTEKILTLELQRNKGVTFTANSTYGEFNERLHIGDLEPVIGRCNMSLELLERAMNKDQEQMMVFAKENLMVVSGEDEEYVHLIAYLSDTDDED